LHSNTRDRSLQHSHFATRHEVKDFWDEGDRLRASALIMSPVSEPAVRVRIGTIFLAKGTPFMTTVIKPSALLPRGIYTQTINNLPLFKFTEELGDRLQALLDKQKADQLTPDEAIELATIGELDDFFSYINAAIAAQANGNS